MEKTITIEIELPIKFNPVEGYPPTHWEPGEPPHIEDIDFDEKVALRLIETVLEDPELETELLDFASDEALSRMEDHADRLYEEHKDKLRGL